MYLNFYKDAACTDLYKTVEAPLVTYASITTPVRTFTHDGVVYKYYDSSNGGNISGVPITDHDILLDYRQADLPAGSKLYLKNGLIIGDARVTSSTMRFESLGWRSGFPPMAANNSTINNSNKPLIWAWSIEVNGEIFIGFNRTINAVNPWDGYILPQCFVELKFWTEALRPPYDYGTGTDIDGGQGTGKMPHTDIPLSATPTRIVPLGGRGLHAYRINAAAYASLQGYLWGDASTLAKSLWQKFQNKTHSPVNCIVGCYSLPNDFMPASGSSTGIQIAGLMLSPINGTCTDVTSNIGFCDKTYTFDKINFYPYGSFLDYTGVSCKLHLPFCGEIALSTEQIINSGITVRYRVDQLNGNVVAAVRSNGVIIAELSGNCAYNVPVSGGDDGTLQRLGALAASSVQIAAGNIAGGIASAASGLAAEYTTQLINSALNGNMAACENRVPYLVWIYNGTAYSPDYMDANGVPCEFSGTLSAFSGGYGEFEIMQSSSELQAAYDIMGATESEREEIRSLLKGGVFV